jgi:hypothetical protein
MHCTMISSLTLIAEGELKTRDDASGGSIGQSA